MPARKEPSLSSADDEKNVDGVCGKDCCWNSGDGCGKMKRDDGDMSDCDKGASIGG